MMNTPRAAREVLMATLREKVEEAQHNGPEESHIQEDKMMVWALTVLGELYGGWTREFCDLATELMRDPARTRWYA